MIAGILVLSSTGLAHAGFLDMDLWYWDDVLPMGEGVGTEVDGKTVVAFHDGRYTLEQGIEVPKTDAKVKLTRPRRFDLGELTIQASHHGGGKTIGLVMPKVLAPCVSTEPCGVPASEWPGRTETTESIVFQGKNGQALVVPAPIPEGPDLRILEDRAPFPVLATFRNDGRIVVFSGEVELSPEQIEPVAGDTVVLLDHQEATVVDVLEDRLRIRVPGGDRAEPLPNPQNRIVPAWASVLALLGATATYLAAQRSRARSVP
jgi:hypothetical protein